MIDVIIIAFNESLNLPHCLKSVVDWTRKVYVVDSGSTDGTTDLARTHGAEVVHQPWLGYAAQKNWALDNLPLQAEWTLVLDADEQITPALKHEIETITRRPLNQTPENGFFINRLSYFLDKPIHHCGYFPSWNLRLFKRGLARYENRRVHEHMIIDNPVGYIKEPMRHNDRRDLEFFYAKHNRYSSLEALELYQEISRGRQSDSANLTQQTRRRRWLKYHIIHRIPFPSVWRFLYMFVIRFGFLDGWVGFRFCQFIAQYDAMVALKLKTLLYEGKDADELSGKSSTQFPSPGKAAETFDMTTGKRQDSDQAIDASSLTDRPLQLHPESSPWSTKGKVARTAWMTIGKPLFRFSFHNWYAYRRLILRCFGASIGRGVVIRPSVHIEIPWMLDIRADATVGDYAILYSLGRITIGERAIISQYAHLCAGTHDYTDHTFKLQRTPITVGPDAWIGTDAFIGPGVEIGRLSVVGARSSVYKNLPAEKVCVGNPAKPVKDRILR